MDDDLFVQPTDPGQIYDGLSSIITDEPEQHDELKNTAGDQVTSSTTKASKQSSIQSLLERYDQPEEEPQVGTTTKKVTTSLALPFQQKIVTDMLAEDGLLILARGMGMLNITVNLVHCLDVIGTDKQDKQSKESPENSLVIVVGAQDDDNQKIREGLRDLATLDGLNESVDEFDEEFVAKNKEQRRGLTVFTDAVTKTKRQTAYDRGGVFSVSPVVMVADMLNNTINRKKITGIVILNAHRVREDSSVAFLLCLFRDENKAGFIKALSDQPERFNSGFSALSKHLKWLKVRRLWLWPRFHVKVRQALDSNRDVAEVAVHQSSAMEDIGKSLRAIMESCLSELRQLAIVKQNVENANDSWTIDNAILKNFMGIIRSSLGPVWHQMKTKHRQLVYDMGELLQLLERSTNASAVSFLTDLTCVHRLARVAILKGMTSWIEHPAADHLLKTAHERVFNKEQPIEEPPKLDQLGNILREISNAQQHNLRETEAKGPALVMCSSFRGELSAAMRYLSDKGGCYSAQEFMEKRRRAYTNWQKSLVNVKRIYESGISMQQAKLVGNQPKEQPSARPDGSRFQKRRRVRGGGSSQVPRASTPVQDNQKAEVQDQHHEPAFGEIGLEIEDENEEGDDDDVLVEDVMTQAPDPSNAIHVMDMSDMVFVEQYNDSTNETLLEELQPSYIILYSPDMSFIRRVEEYKFTHPEVRVFFMYYKDSVEEQRFLAAVRREKDTFTTLIREKAKLPIIMEDADTAGTTPAILRAVSSRIAGGQEEYTSEQPRIIVDAREIQSSLAFQIYKHKCDVLPVVLTVGDYVLTPDVCVERKAISDLVQSLNSGRLYKQCVEMCKYYDLPVLLIEFDEAKSFSSLSMDEAERLKNSEMEKLLQESTQTKLTLLLLTFPKLKCIWSSSPFQTAEIFMDLKQARNEPSLDDAKGFGRQPRRHEVENDDAIAMLQSIPGITHQNYRKVVDNVENIKQLAAMPQPLLEEIIGKQAAKKVFEFLSKQSAS